MLAFDLWGVSEETEAVRAELICAAHELDGTVVVTADGRLAGTVLGELLPDKDVRWLGATNPRSPLLCERGPRRPQLDRVLLDGDLRGRPVIDAPTGEVLPHVRGPLDDPSRNGDL